MTTITADDLRLHALSVAGHPDGVRLVRVGADLRNIDLTDTDLRGAILRGADMRGADLRDTDMRGADMRGAILTYTDMRGAILIGANLRGADMRGANLAGADLACAILRNVDLRDAILTGAELMYTDLRGAQGLVIAADAPARLLAVARAALQPGALEMADWHTCPTTHCISGTAVYQAGEVGRFLEAVVGNHMAGLHLLGAEAALHFYDSNEQAREYLQGVIDAAGGETP